MKIIQILPSLAYGDAIGNDVLALNDTIKECGYDTEIYAEGIDSRLPQNTARPILEFSDLAPEDILIYHLAIGWRYVDLIKKQDCKKIAIYHNVTPPNFYYGYNQVVYDACKKGLEEVESLRNTFDYCLADSEFNKEDLIRMGYTCKIDVLPILIAFDDYKKTPFKKIIDQYADGNTNIIFVGRIVPNKKHEDVIAAFYYYKKNFNPRARLFLVGSYSEKEIYYNRLKDYIAELGLTDVYFPGHIKFEEMLAYYKIADIFLCMSEHEGFCVPLVESMIFDVPIVAYDSSAISYTLGKSGFLLKRKNSLETAGVIDRIVNDKELRQQLITGQKERLTDFAREKIKTQFCNYLNTFIKNDK